MSPNSGRGGGCCGISANEYSCAHGAQINFRDLTPYLTYGSYEFKFSCWQKRGEEFSQIADINEWWRGEGTCINGPWRSRKQVRKFKLYVTEQFGNISLMQRKHVGILSPWSRSPYSGPIEGHKWFFQISCL
jgi:hypothetical protein